MYYSYHGFLFKGVNSVSEYTKNEAMDWAWENITGQWSTLVTPFTEYNEIDEAGLRSNIQHIRLLGTKGIGCAWGMGEFWALSIEERKTIYQIVAEEKKPGWYIAAHVSHSSIKDMVSLANYAEGLGFDLLVVAPPYFVTKSEQQVVDWVKILASNTSLAIMFYNSPQFGIVMSPEGLKDICNIDNVVGVKEASFNRDITIETHRTIGEHAIISAPDEWVLFEGKKLGFQQKVMFANTSDWRFDNQKDNYYVQFIDRATKGDVDAHLYESHIQPLKSLSDTWWQRIMKKQNGSLPVPMIKYWGELMGMKGGPIRPPLYDLSDSEKQELRDDIKLVRKKIRSNLGGE